MSSALIKESSGSAVEELCVPGLVSLILKHDVKATSANYQWTGPRIDPAEWAAMMAFFEWTYLTEKSEAQVRWYVHPTLGWKCWAFPQKGGTSMTTKELPLDSGDSAQQRAKFNPSEGWLYYMTVHHHCSMSAFQSGTDEQDEKKVDGLHITIGNMDKPKRDIHVRMYQRHHRFDPYMNDFWDVGEELRKRALELMKTFEVEVDFNKIARAQMALSAEQIRLQAGLPKPDPEFPELWKKNYLVEGPVFEIAGNGNYWQGHIFPDQNGKIWCSFCSKHGDHSWGQCPERAREDVKRAVEIRESLGKQKPDDRTLDHIYDEICAQLMVMGYDDEDQNALFDLLDDRDGEAYALLFNTLAENKVTVAEFHYHHLAYQVAVERAMVGQEMLEDKKGQDPGNPMPPRDSDSY